MSHVLLGNSRYLPTSFRVGFIKCPLDVFLKAYVEWRSGHGYTSKSRQVEGIGAAIDGLGDLMMPPKRYVVCETDSAWTGYLDNGRQGSDPFSAIGYLSQAIGCEGLIVTYVQQSPKSYSYVGFELYASAPREWLNLERSVSAYNDGGRWKFFARGAQQPFEEVEQYTNRKIADRFTPGMLDRYCRAIGVRAFDEDFYGPKCSVIETHGPASRTPARIQTRADARRELGID